MGLEQRRSSGYLESSGASINFWEMVIGSGECVGCLSFNYFLVIGFFFGGGRCHELGECE